MRGLEIFNGKKVLITGHTGFKGSWLTIWLSCLGAKVVGVSNNEVTNPSIFSVSKISSIVDDYRLDIRNAKEMVSQTLLSMV